MCLEISRNLTKEYKKKNEDIICYKLLTPFHRSPWQSMLYKHGWNKAEGEHLLIYSIYQGALHVMLDEEEAKKVQYKLLIHFGIESVIHKIVGKIEDLVAVGSFEGYKGACFTKLYMELEECA